MQITMKKLTCLTLTLMLLLACCLTASAEEGSRILVACFSATGNTMPLAEKVAELLGAELYEILPETPYTEDDLNWNDSDSRTSIECNDDTARPAVAGEMPDLTRYDTVIIAHPIWWGQAPKIIRTFLEAGDFSGKTLVTLCTSASSGLGTSAKTLQELLNDDSITWLESRRFPAGADERDLSDWLKTIGLLK